LITETRGGKVYQGSDADREYGYDTEQRCDHLRDSSHIAF
jgi:hypothetical protein